MPYVNIKITMEEQARWGRRPCSRRSNERGLGGRDRSLALRTERCYYRLLVPWGPMSFRTAWQNP